MQGLLHLTSEENKGSHFTLQVKLQKSSRERLHLDAVQTSNNVTFAIVDELETSRLYLASLLRN